MATYVIGDIQGCFTSLQNLLTQLPQEEANQYWVVGDLVNRGAESLEALRFFAAHPNFNSLLGNHDLSLLALAAGVPGKQISADLKRVLDAPDGAELINWLRFRPLLHKEQNYLLVHAGLLPQWSAVDAVTLAGEVQQELRGPHWKNFMHALFGNSPAQWDDNLQGAARWRCIVNVMTRMRFCTSDGRLEFNAKGKPEGAPPNCFPWFDLPHARWAQPNEDGHTVVCGHWSAAGLRKMNSVIMLDSGCVWGGCLSAIRLSDQRIWQIECSDVSAEINED